MEREEIQKRLKKELDKNRYEHTLGGHVYGRKPCHGIWI